MYFVTAVLLDSLTGNAPYPLCQQKPSRDRDCFFIHFEGPFLDLLNYLGHRQVPAQVREDMHVAVRTTYLDRQSIELDENPGQICAQPLANIRCDKRFSVFRTENDMDDNF